jgi:hypothetical protein
VLGSLGCSDDNGPATGTCAALETGQVCAPSAFCSCDAPAASGDPTCLQTLLGLAPTPRIDCVVPAQGAPGAFESCSGRDSAPIDLNEFYTGTQCRQPVIGSLLLDDFGTSHDFGGAEMELSNPNDACTFDITWKHSTRTSTDAADFGFVEVPTSTGALAIPIVLHFMQSDCVHGTIDAFNCTLAGNTAAPTRDPMWSCAP